MAKRFNFYSADHLLMDFPDAQYYMIYGERSNGKTYDSLLRGLRNYAKTGEQFAYLRRWGEDIRTKNLSNLFSGHIENGVLKTLFTDKWNQIYYRSGKFFLEKREDDGTVTRDENPVGYAFDLNGMEHYKSTSFPRVTLIIFDEFLSRNGYLPNEFTLFQNSLSTIIRHRDNVKIFMLGNTVNQSCPYFNEMGLTHIKKQKQGTVDLYTYPNGAKVVVEYAESSYKRGGKASDVYFAFDDPEINMITTGIWEMNIYPHLNVRYRPKDVVANFFIDFEGDLLHGEVVSLDTGPFIFLHRKTTPIKDESKDIVYTTYADERWNYRMCLTKQSDDLSCFILKCLRENKIFYSTNEIGECMRNYVMWSDSYSIKN